MEAVVHNTGTVIHTEADRVEMLELVTSGKVEIISKDYHITAGRGSILGLFEYPGENYSYTYIARETCTTESYPFRRKSDVDPIVRDRADECDVLVAANAALALSVLGHYKRRRRRADTLVRLIKKGYADYRSLCSENGLQIQPWRLAEELEPYQPERELPDWLGDYYDQLGIMPGDVRKAFYSTHTSLTTAALLEAVGHIQLIKQLFDELGAYIFEVTEAYGSSADLFDLYLNLRLRDDTGGKLAAETDKAVEEYEAAVSKLELLPKELIEERRQRYENAASSAPAATKKQIEETLPEGEESSTAELDNPVSPAAEAAEKDPLEALRGSLDRILAYTELDEGEEERFRELISRYKQVNDRNASDDETRKLRKDITKGFFDLYESAAIASMEEWNTPPVPVRLFLYFGYMDEELVGRENALQLLHLLERIDSDRENRKKGEKRHVMLIDEWLAAVYNGETEPSRNEFEQDYPAWLKSRRLTGDITEEQEQRYLNSPRERMRFELDNFFHLSMRIASGRPAVFCPVLSEHNIIRSLEQTFVTPSMVMCNWETIKKTDFSLFFREALYSNSEYGIPKETVLMEVMPEVILLPMIGSRGGLWQEISGLRRDTPGRMFLPIFSSEDVAVQQLRMAGQFRWQICRRVQGARWNDVSDPSLTSEYWDYIQFYKKNRDLSPEAREKLKSELLACKNSYENVFVLDYVQWIRSEAQGSPRLNKVAKRILFTYCPFSAEIRKRLESNPMYADLVRRHENLAARKKKLAHMKYDRIRKEKGGLPRVIEECISFYES